MLPVCAPGVEGVYVCGGGGRLYPLSCLYISIICHLLLPRCARGSGCSHWGLVDIRRWEELPNLSRVGLGKRGVRRTQPPLPAPLQSSRTRL